MPTYPTHLIADTPDAMSLKREVMAHFGLSCTCPGCGETRMELLQLDHIHGSGSDERRAMKRQGSSYYREVKAAIDAGTPKDQRWLATLQIHCQRCNLSKGTGPACTLDHALSPSALEPQGFQGMLLSDESSEVLSKNSPVSDDPLVQLATRIRKSSKDWLMQQDGNLGQVVDQLIEAKRSGEQTVLAELRAFVAYQREVNRELFNLCSDVALKGSDPDPREVPEVPVVPQPPAQYMPWSRTMPWRSRRGWRGWLARCLRGAS